MEIHSQNPTSLAPVLAAAKGLEDELRRFLAAATGVTPDAQRLFDAADAAYAAGRPGRARELLDGALAAQPAPRLRATIHQLSGWLDLWSGSPLSAHELLVTEGEAIASDDPERAARMLADAAVAAAFAGDHDRSAATAHRARTLAAGVNPVSRAAIDLLAGVCLLLGADAAAGEQLIRAAMRALGDPLADERVRNDFRSAVAALYWIEEYGTAASVLDTLIERGRGAKDPLLPGWLDTRAAIDFRLGRWSAAAARSAEALRLSRELGQAFQAASCLTTLARIAAGRGRGDMCRRRTSEALAVAGDTSDLVYGWTLSAGGLLELGLGRIDFAIDALERLDSSPAARMATDPAIAQGTSDLVEAYVRAGRTADAERALDRFEARLAESRRTWAAAAVHRCRGLLAPGSRIDEEFGEALRWHRATPTPFELARTELCYGERLRRGRRRGDARTYLRSALGVFEQLGARPWAERAQRELAATSGRAQADAANLRGSLTPHELRVAALVELGLRNREIATALFVSERTVEYHLTNMYGKLNVRSRTELARVLR